MFHKIEGHWPRREHFHHYMDNLRCTYSLTVDIDVTALRGELKANGLKTYPAQIYILASAVNRLPEFRMGLTEDGKPGYWDALHPAYTVFHPGPNTFSSMYTLYDADFSAFYNKMQGDIEQYAQPAALFPQGDAPPNCFNISSLPWVNFTAFNLNVFADGSHLAPIFTLGKYSEAHGKTLLPLAMQLHHAACDGYHAGQFVEAVREMAQNPKAWL